MDLASIVCYINSKNRTVMRLRDDYRTIGRKYYTHISLNKCSCSGIIRSHIPEKLSAVIAITVIISVVYRNIFIKSAVTGILNIDDKRIIRSVSTYDVDILRSKFACIKIYIIKPAATNDIDILIIGNNFNNTVCLVICFRRISLKIIKSLIKVNIESGIAYINDL